MEECNFEQEGREIGAFYGRCDHRVGDILALDEQDE